MKKKVSVHELKKYCEAHRPRKISFNSENQSWFCASDPCKVDLTFQNMQVFDNPNMVCLKSGANTLYFDRVHHAEIETDGHFWTVFTIFCGERGKQTPEVTYKLLADE